MEKFNTKRFANVLKWDFMNNWKYTLWLFLVMIVVFTCMLGLTYFNNASDYMQGVHDTMMSVQASACNFILSIIILAGASRMFLPLKDKQSATAFLSLPATNLVPTLCRCCLQNCSEQNMWSQDRRHSSACGRSIIWNGEVSLTG